MSKFFVSSNGYYEVNTADYDVVMSNREWQRFADRLGEEFMKLGEVEEFMKLGEVEEKTFEEEWNDAHNRVCKEFGVFFK